MGSFCTCSGPLKFNKDIIIPNTSLNKKIIHTKTISPNEKNEKQKKKENKLKRFKTFTTDSKGKKSEKKKILISPERDRTSYVSSGSCVQHYKVITNSKINKNLLKELYSLYEPLNDNIAVEEIQLLTKVR